MARIKVEKLKPADLTAYIEWLQDPTRHKIKGVGNGTSRGQSATVYVLPFNIDLPPQTFAHAKATRAALTELEAKVTSYLVVNLANADFGVPLKKYSAARLSHRTGMAKGQAKLSHIIPSREYIPYGGTSHSLPFGKSSSTQHGAEDEAGVFEQDLLPQFLVDGSLPQGQEVTLIKEKFVPA